MGICFVRTFPLGKKQLSGDAFQGLDLEFQQHQQPLESSNRLPDPHDIRFQTVDPAVRDTDQQTYVSSITLQEKLYVVWMILLHLRATLTTLVDAVTVSEHRSHLILTLTN